MRGIINGIKIHLQNHHRTKQIRRTHKKYRSYLHFAGTWKWDSDNNSQGTTFNSKHVHRHKINMFKVKMSTFIVNVCPYFLTSGPYSEGKVNPFSCCFWSICTMNFKTKTSSLFKVIFMLYISSLRDSISRCFGSLQIQVAILYQFNIILTTWVPESSQCFSNNNCQSRCAGYLIRYLFHTATLLILSY